MPYKDSTNLKLSYYGELEEKNKFENYFPSKDKGIIIYKNKKKENNIYINDSVNIEFSGLFDYDNKSQILIVYKEEDNIKKIAIYKNSNKENKKNNNVNLKIFINYDINYLFNENSRLNKIMLVPCVYG